MRLSLIGKPLSIAILTGLPAVAALVAACDSPTRPDETVKPPLPPPPPVISGVTIEGPGVVTLGETAEFKLFARLTDGTQRDVTKEATWAGGWGDVVSIQQPGQVQGRSAGQTQIEAGFAQHWASKNVLVLPAGTYLLQGRVNEAGAPTAPVVEALVEVRSGVGAGLTVFTDRRGTYRLYGVAGLATLRVTKSGYGRVEQRVTVEDHQVLNLELPLLAERPDVSGVYSLTVTAAAHCADTLPEPARARTFRATIEQEGPSLAVRLGEASLLPSYDRFGGRVEPGPGRVLFDLTWYDGEEPRVVEEVPGLGLVVPDGVAIVKVSGNRLAGTLSGAIRAFNGNSFWDSPSAWCFSNEHQFVLTR